jgi:protein tyrosine phosphatase (PTP) superfamily phosphohydrolase (DUF442 family)
LKQVHSKKFSRILIITSAALVVATATILIRRGYGDESLPAPQAQAESARISDTSAEVQTALPLFHRLDENYMRGSRPLHGGISALTRLGVRTVVDLRSPYDHTDDIGVAAERAGLGYKWLPMSVWNPPTDAEAQEFVRLVTDRSKGPFFVFCDDGLHRTGEMSAIYRVVTSRWSVEQALKEMDEVGFNPYYYSLRNYVWTYARKFHPAAVPPQGRALSAFEK